MSAAIHARPEEARLREQIVEFGASLFARGLTAGSSGNLSVRTDDGLGLCNVRAGSAFRSLRAW